MSMQPFYSLQISASDGSFNIESWHDAEKIVVRVTCALCHKEITIEEHVLRSPQTAIERQVEDCARLGREILSRYICGH
jgi:hypothetical protein